MLEDENKTGWAHAPHHRYQPGAMMITAATYQKMLYFKGPERLTHLQNIIFEVFRASQWEILTWAVMANHYHLIVFVPEGKVNLKAIMQEVHSKTARWVNALDGTPDRQVWFQYRDTHLTNARSYYARYHYVLRNPEKHGLVQDARHYKWCSMWWFDMAAEPALKKTVYSFKIDRVNVDDDY